jgi:hypothetical protein
MRYRIYLAYWLVRQLCGLIYCLRLFLLQAERCDNMTINGHMSLHKFMFMYQTDVVKKENANPLQHRA